MFKTTLQIFLSGKYLINLLICHWLINCQTNFLLIVYFLWHFLINAIFIKSCFKRLWSKVCWFVAPPIFCWFCTPKNILKFANQLFMQFAANKRCINFDAQPKVVYKKWFSICFCHKFLFSKSKSTSKNWCAFSNFCFRKMWVLTDFGRKVMGDLG